MTVVIFTSVSLYRHTGKSPVSIPSCNPRITNQCIRTFRFACLTGLKTRTLLLFDGDLVPGYHPDPSRLLLAALLRGLITIRFDKEIIKPALPGMFYRQVHRQHRRHPYKHHNGLQPDSASYILIEANPTGLSKSTTAKANIALG